MKEPKLCFSLSVTAFAVVLFFSGCCQGFVVVNQPQMRLTHPHFVFADECQLDSLDSGSGDCVDLSGYVVDTEAGLEDVYVAEIESLRGRFESFEAEGTEGTNMIKYSRRRQAQRGTLRKTNGDVIPNTRVANIEYNHLIEER